MRAILLLACLYASAFAQAGELPRDCAECPELVVLPAGHFVMGSPDTEAERSRDEGPQHEVTFAKPFAIGKFEVTHGEFAAFVTDTARTMAPCFWDSGFPRGPDHPAACLAVGDAEEYLAWLSRRTGHRYRLPSEAEWEYAVRGGAALGDYRVYSFGDGKAGLCTAANTRVEGCDDGFAGTAPKGSFPANGFGLHDMHGNVWEYIADCVTETYVGAPANGAAWSAGDCTRRIIRGGGYWNQSAGHFRSANRGWLGLKMMDVMTGFRVVREVD
jgi:formylglycine-generating enzyme required for sulfatase activity